MTPDTLEENAKRKPGFVISGRCITEAEFQAAMKEKEEARLLAEQRKQQKKEERGKKRRNGRLKGRGRRG